MMSVHSRPAAAEHFSSGVALPMPPMLAMPPILATLQGKRVVDHLGQVARVAVPLLGYFAVMWALGMALCYAVVRLAYPQAVTIAFTASSNNFELAIAVATATFGAGSQEALAATVGPLVEMPVLLGLSYLALWLRKRLSWRPQSGDPS